MLSPSQRLPGGKTLRRKIGLGDRRQPSRFALTRSPTDFLIPARVVPCASRGICSCESRATATEPARQRGEHPRLSPPTPARHPERQSRDLLFVGRRDPVPRTRSPGPKPIHLCPSQVVTIITSRRVKLTPFKPNRSANMKLTRIAAFTMALGSTAFAQGLPSQKV